MLIRGIVAVMVFCLASLATAFISAPAEAADPSVSHVVAFGWMATDFHDQTNPGCSIGGDASAPGGRLMMGANRRRIELIEIDAGPKTRFKRIGRAMKLAGFQHF